MEVRLLDQQPAARSNRGGHPLQHLWGMIGDLVQQGSTGDEIVSVGGQLGRPDVRLRDGEVLRGNQLHQHRIDVHGGDRPGGTHGFTQPLGDAAVAAAQLEAIPARSDTQRAKVTAGPRVEDLRHEVEPLILDSRRVIKDVGLQRRHRSSRVPERVMWSSCGRDRTPAPVVVLDNHCRKPLVHHDRAPAILIRSPTRPAVEPWPAQDPKVNVTCGRLLADKAS